MILLAEDSRHDTWRVSAAPTNFPITVVATGKSRDYGNETLSFLSISVLAVSIPPKRVFENKRLTG